MRPWSYQVYLFIFLTVFRGGGTRARIARGGIRLVHGHTKSTLIMYFSGMKIDPKYAFFACIFLNFGVMSFPKFVCMTKNTPFFPILHVFAPLNDVRAYSAWSWKTTLITWIFGRAWYLPWHSSGHRGTVFNGTIINTSYPNYVNFWTSLIPPLTFEWPPWDCF